MKLTTGIFDTANNKRLDIDLDRDMFMRLVNPMRSYKLRQGTIYVKNKKNKWFPIWRVVRNNFDKEFNIRYKDGCYWNLKRENLILKRREV